MTNSPLDALEIELRELSRLMTDPREGECLLCYVYRMLGEFNCSGLHWATRYRGTLLHRGLPVSSDGLPAWVHTATARSC